MINSQKEYDNEMKKFKRNFKKLSPLSFIRNPKTFVNAIVTLYDNAGKIGLFSKEYVQEQKKKVYDALKLNPSEAKEWIKKHWIKKHLKKVFSRG